MLNKQVVIDNFHEAHRRDYGHAFVDQDIEIITLRVVATAVTKNLRWPLLDNEIDSELKKAFLYKSPTTFDDGDTLDTPRYDRNKLSAGHIVPGPAIIIQHDSTSLVPPGFRATVSSHGNLIVRS